MSFDLDSVGIGAGDIWSTTGDMDRWDSALMGQTLLSGESRQTMFAPHARVPPTPLQTTALHYGYGWIITELQGHKVIFHTGGNAGFVSLNAWLPDDDAVVIFLSNDDQIDPQETGMHIASDVLGIKELNRCRQIIGAIHPHPRAPKPATHVCGGQAPVGPAYWR